MNAILPVPTPGIKSFVPHLFPSLSCPWNLPNNPIIPGLPRWRAWRRCVSPRTTTVDLLWLLQLYIIAPVLAVVVLARAIRRWRRLRLLTPSLPAILLRIVRLRIVVLCGRVAGGRASGRPARAAVRCVAHSAASAGADAGEDEEDNEGAEDDEAEDEPAGPGIPCRVAAAVADVVAAVRAGIRDGGWWGLGGVSCTHL